MTLKQTIYSTFFVSALILVLLILGCTVPNTDAVKQSLGLSSDVTSTDISKPIKAEPYPVKGWDFRYYELIKKELATSNIYNIEPKRMNFCPNWAKLSQDKKAVEFTNLLHAITIYESDTKLNSTYVETTLGIDPFTKKQVASEGLFQLSYQDSISYKGCAAINWSKDKDLDLKDLNKTIFQPEVQFQCTIFIMSQILTNRSTENAIGSGRYGLGRYWQVLREDTKWPSIKKDMVSFKSECF